ncbi:hypothetical protein ACHAWC_010361 [Mediolabrus comicus]
MSSSPSSKKSHDSSRVNDSKNEEDAISSGSPSQPSPLKVSANKEATSLADDGSEQQHQSEQNLNASADNNNTTAASTADAVETAESSSENNNDEISHKELLSHILNIFKSVLERSSHVEDLICGDSDIIMDDDDSDTDDNTSIDVDVDVDKDIDDSGIPKKAASTTTEAAATAHPHSSSLLSVPPSWKRHNYASKTLSEIEDYIIKSNNSPAKKSDNDNDDDGQLLFNVEYNECSLLALANWTMMSDNTNNNNDKQNWEQYKRSQIKHRATATSKYNMPLPPPCAFRVCGVCGNFGHYELECDLLIDYNDRHDDDDGCGSVGSSDNKGGKRKSRLDNETRERVISTLAKEIRIQRTLCSLLSNAKREEAEEVVEATKKKKKEMIKDGSEEDDQEEDDASYWVTSQRCNVCLSALGEQSMLVCDGCDELYHMHCLNPPLEDIPDGDWYCDVCVAYDDDVSSTVELEGCNGFVIESRKRSVAEEEERGRNKRRKEEGYAGISLGGDNSWIAALSILSQTHYMPDFPSIYDIRRDYDGERRRGETEFVTDEVVWAKRQVGHLKYWPGIVSKVGKKGLDVRYFPLDDCTLDRLHHSSELLPFFPYFECLGYEKVMTNIFFRRAVELGIIKTGLKTLGQALNYARCGTQMSLQGNDHHNITAKRMFTSSGWIAPTGWENANIDEVDGFMIMSRNDADDERKNKSSPLESFSVDGSDTDMCGICQEGGELLICDGGDKGGGCGKAFHIECIGRALPQGDWICKSCAKEFGYKVGAEGFEWGTENVEKTDTIGNMTAEFDVEDEIVGGTVSWREVLPRAKTSYGTVLSVDVQAKKALVRSILILSDSSESYGRLFPSQPFAQTKQSIPIRATDIGSTVWMSLDSLRFVSGRAGERDLSDFKEILSSHMTQEVESFESRCKQAEIERERSMVELSQKPVPENRSDHDVSTLLPVRSAPPSVHSAPPPTIRSSVSGLLVVGKTPSGLLQCPNCPFVTQHRCGMSNHAKHCLQGRDYIYAE